MLNNLKLSRSIYGIGLLVVMAILSMAPVLAGPSRDAELTKSNIRMPSEMVANRKYDIVVKVRNNGDVKWNSGSENQLLTTVHRTPSGSSGHWDKDFLPTVNLSRPVNTGDKYEFHYKITAPNVTGTYELDMSMANGKDRFGDIVRLTIKVVPEK